MPQELAPEVPAGMPQHPVLRATAVVSSALKSVADANPTFMVTRDKASALHSLVRIEAQVAELRLRILADASDVAEQTAARDVAGWLSHHAHCRLEDARADLALARSLDRRYPALARAMREGRANLAQAQVIARALDALPREVPAETVSLAETTLVGHAANFGPRPLARLGRRILDVVAPDIADKAEAKRLADLEAAGRRKTRLTLRRMGDGTTRLSGLIPDLAATRLATYLEAFTNPRKAEANKDKPSSNASGDPVERLTYPRRLGEAFCQLLEHIDPQRLPQHGGDATTVVVTIDFEALRRELGVAGVIGSDLPGDESVGDAITASEARRLACNANILPVVLGDMSEILDLGRARRFFSRAQNRALLVRDRTCRAEGCTIPGTWAEAHHWTPWSLGGLTDLSNAVLLCSHHHHRAHDPAYTAERLPDGGVRFNRRR